MIINSKQTALYLKQQATAPVPPNEFIETMKPLMVVPKFATVDTNRLSGSMNTKDSVIDTCRASIAFVAEVALRETGATFTDAPEWTELAKISGMTGTAGTDLFTIANKNGSISKGSAVVTVDAGREAFNMTNTLVGDIEFVLPVGKLAQVNTKLSGYIDSPKPTPVPSPVKNTLNTNPALVVSCADIITLTGTSIPAEKIVFKMNPDIQNTYTMGGANGIKQDMITDYGVTCEITFPVESATFGREAGLIDAGTISQIRCIIGADAQGKPVDGKSFLFLADASKAVNYVDSVNGDLLQRVLTLRLYDGAEKALRILSGKIAGL